MDSISELFNEILTGGGASVKMLRGDGFAFQLRGIRGYKADPANSTHSVVYYEDGQVMTYPVTPNEISRLLFPQKEEG